MNFAKIKNTSGPTRIWESADAKKFNPGGGKRADWKIGDKMVEYFGLAGNLEYDFDELSTAWNLAQWQNSRDQMEKWLLNPEKFDIKDFVKVINSRMHTISDYWSYSYQTYQRGTGDCEDGTILLYDITTKKNFDKATLNKVHTYNRKTRKVFEKKELLKRLKRYE